jgi:hypothetical protein
LIERHSEGEKKKDRIDLNRGDDSVCYMYESSFTKNTRSEKRDTKKTIDNTHHVAKLLVSDPVPGLIAAVGLSER